MIYSAQLNEHNICVNFHAGLKAPSGNVEIEAIDEDYLHRKYEDGVWSDEKFVPDAVALEQSTLEKMQKDLDDSVMELSTAISMLMMGGNGDV